MLEIRNLTKVFDSGEDRALAVDKINLSVKQGEFVVLIGASGCGKTTTLKMINRLVKPTSGEILINDTPTTDMNDVDLRRGIGYVIQDIGLFPHMTIAENVEIVPKLNKIDKQERRSRTYELLDMVDLDPDVYADRYPAELSGGQQQRIGVLRALAAEPNLILMDEPFGALDPITRDQLQDEMKDLQKRLNITIIFVTHDIDEALKLGDKIVLMKDGEIVQADSPDKILKEPANDYVREFIGEERLSDDQPDSTPVSDVMVRNPLFIYEETTPKDALSQLKKHNSDLAVVVDSNKRYQGVISASQIQLKQSKANTVEKIIEKQKPAYEGMTLRDVAETLANGVQVVCVVNKRNQPIGLVSRATLLKGLVEIWDEQ